MYIPRFSVQFQITFRVYCDLIFMRIVFKNIFQFGMIWAKFPRTDMETSMDTVFGIFLRIWQMVNTYNLLISLNYATKCYLVKCLGRSIRLQSLKLVKRFSDINSLLFLYQQSWYKLLIYYLKISLKWNLKIPKEQTKIKTLENKQDNW